MFWLSKLFLPPPECEKFSYRGRFFSGFFRSLAHSFFLCSPVELGDFAEFSVCLPQLLLAIVCACNDKVIEENEVVDLTELPLYATFCEIYHSVCVYNGNSVHSQFFIRYTENQPFIAWKKMRNSPPFLDKWLW